MIFLLEVFTFFSNKFTPFCKISILMSPSTNISFSNIFKKFRISANICKNYTNRYELGFQKEQIHEDDFYFFRKNICSAETYHVLYNMQHLHLFYLSHIELCCSIQYKFLLQKLLYLVLFHCYQSRLF